MPITFNIEINKSQWQELREALKDIPGAANRAARSALSRTASTGRVRLSRRVRDILNLKASTVNGVMTSTPAKGEGENMSAHIRVSKKGVPLIEFGARQTQPGVSVQVFKTGSREMLRHTFIQTMHNGHEGVFERRGRGDDRVSRLPIDERGGPSVASVLENHPGLMPAAMTEIGDVLQKNLNSQIARFLARRDAAE